MAIAVEMPKMSDTMVEGVLSAWLVEEGQKVSAGDVIAQVETDKATMDLEAYDDGVLLKRVIAEGSSVPIGALIAVLGKAGEDISAILGGSGAPAPVTAAAPEPEAPVAVSADPVGYGDDTGRVKASPLARKMAADLGVSLASVQGSGPEGRIVKRDVEAVAGQTPAPAVAAPVAAPAAQPAPAPAPAVEKLPEPKMQAGFTAKPITQMRRAIARRLAQSKFTAPHFYLVVDVDMEAATSFRTELNAVAEKTGRAKVSFNDFITKACALGLRQHPYVNASWMEEQGEIRFHEVANVAIAVAIDEGLITPVIRNADQKGLSQIADETRDLAKRARDRKLSPDEYEGSTFTTSNLGMFGVESFTAIINPPNSCILAIGAIRDEAVVKGGQVVAGKRMKITLSCDHRVVDGASGAAFLNTVKGYLENPLTMLL